MSIIPPALSRALQFYLSGPLPCPYLPGQVERKLFTRLSDDVTTNLEINSMLTRAGFRRSHEIVYRPACNNCTACVPVRVPVRLFRASRNLKRIAVRNRDLNLHISNAAFTSELFYLFQKYQAVRHTDSDMALMQPDDFEHMLEDGHAETRVYELRDNAGSMLAAVIVDPVTDGLSAVYSFYDPSQSKRSLGTQLILSLIEEVQRDRLSYVYLGYWIQASKKMSYKSRFQPMQALTQQGWDWMD